MTALSTFDVVSTLRDLPALPAIVAELLGSLDRDDAGTKLLAEKLSHDQALTAKTLRLANSSFYGMQNKVTTIQQAIAILGFNSVRTLVVAASITGCFPMDGSGAFDFKAFWRHSVGTALCAKGLARHMSVNPDQAFMVGLLHDISAGSCFLRVALICSTLSSPILPKTTAISTRRNGLCSASIIPRLAKRLQCTGSFR